MAAAIRSQSHHGQPVVSSLAAAAALSVGVGDSLVSSSVGVEVAVVSDGLEMMVRVAVAVVAGAVVPGSVVAGSVVAGAVVAGGVVAGGTSLDLLAEGPVTVRLTVGTDRLPVGSGRFSPPAQPASGITAISAHTPGPMIHGRVHRAMADRTAIPGGRASSTAEHSQASSHPERVIPAVPC
jgi:hypothetical protein